MSNNSNKIFPTPILFLIFNRPDTSRQVFNQIRKARPSNLFIAADGPREDHPEELSLCLSARSIIHDVDWDCDVKNLFHDKNLGCKNAVSDAISWFFSFVDKGIILEDDCLPDLSFFEYCKELLYRYELDDRIGIISGNNFINTSKMEFSYYFTNFPHIWGWATWKRTWDMYDLGIMDWPRLKKTRFLESKFNDNNYIKNWGKIFDDIYENRIDTWDYQLVYILWKYHQLCIAPKFNLVSNIGFGINSTHTTDSENKIANLPVKKMEFPLIHPKKVERNKNFDDVELKMLYISPSKIISLLGKIKRKVNGFLNRIK